VAAELVHAGLERHARAQARLLEDHRERLAGQPVVLAAGSEVGFFRRALTEKSRMISSRERSGMRTRSRFFGVAIETRKLPRSGRVCE
jgi:hypothetical protein